LATFSFAFLIFLLIVEYVSNPIKKKKKEVKELLNCEKFNSWFV
jgi:hypothetical protein